MIRIANKRHWLVSTAALALVSAALTSNASAQSTETQAGGEAQEVIVVGQRRAIQTAQQLKKNSDQIVDSITAVDIGGLPDRSVTEALQRVPGITIGRTNEPRDVDRLNVEGSGIQIRGLTWVRSELNGRDLFSARGGRAISWEDVTPELFAGVDVYKNPSADIVEGGLGGTVNLRTRMPFDAKGQQFAFSADYTRGDLRKEGTPSASLLYSNRFDTNAGEFGVLFSASHSELKTAVNTLAVDPYLAHGVDTTASYDGGTTLRSDVNGLDNSIAGQTLDQVYVPSGIQYRNNHQDRTRSGYYAAFQWRPSDNLELYATFFRTEAEQILKDRFAQTSACCSATNNQSFLVQPATGSNFVFDSNGNFVSGQLVDGGGGGNIVSNSFLLNLGTRYGTMKDNTNDISAGFKWTGDRLTLTGDLQYVQSHREGTDLTVYNFLTVPGGFGLDLSGELPKITMPDATGTADAFSLYAAMDHVDDNDARQYSAKFDATYAFADDFWLKDIKVGLRTTSRYATSRDGGYNWQPISPQWLFGSNTAKASLYPQYQDVVSFDNFFQGDASVPSLLMPSFDLASNPQLLVSHINDLLDGPTPAGAGTPNANEYGYYCETCGNGTIPWGPGAGQYSPFSQGLRQYLALWASPNRSEYWMPFNGDYNLGFSRSGGRGINRQNEKTTALYTKVRFGGETFFGKTLSWGENDMSWDGNFGLRVVKTETTGRGFASIGYIDPAQKRFASPAAAAKIDAANGQSFEREGGTDYTDVLPSLNLRLKVTDSFFIRYAASKNIVRPDFYQLSPSLIASATLQSRPATVADGIVNEQTNQPYTQAELDTAVANNQTVQYFTDVAFGFNSGNPALKPMRANSFDLSGEWYFHGGMMALGVFKKDIYDYIQSNTASVTILNSDGTPVQAVGIVPQNMGHGEVYGMEFQHQQFYDFLPGALSGLGTEFNLTILESRGAKNTSNSVTDNSQIGASKLDLPLEQLSRYTTNATLLYNKYGFDARLAYNWRSRYLMSASASNLMVPVYSKSFGQLDGSLLYSVNPHVKIGVQAVNLLNSRMELEMDQRDSWFLGTQGNMSDSLIRTHSWTVNDRRVSVILRATF